MVGRIRILLGALVAVLVGASLISEASQPVGAQPAQALVPDLEVEVLADGLSIPWDLAMTSEGNLVFTERGGKLSVRRPTGDIDQVSADLGDLFVAGESGLLGLVLAPDFDQSRRFYTCQARTGPQIQVVGWTMAADYSSAERFANPLVGGIPLATGRHGGCRLRFGPSGQLWIATGDAAQSSVPQDLTSLGGKVLRVDPLTGEGSANNPFASSANANTRRVYTYGHRNVQGLDLRPGTQQMWTVEHGPNIDDEINRLVAGGNYGWDPGPGYDEGVPMTDKVKFPDAIDAKWSTGSSTLALSGGVFVRGRDWGALRNSFAVAALKAQSLRFFRVNQSAAVVALNVSPELESSFGRLRTPMLAPDGSLLLTTANGSNDRILRITPVAEPIGSFDAIIARDGKATVRGWAIDANRASKPVRVRVLADGEPVRVVKAQKDRRDVGELFPTAGRKHGYVLNVALSPGEHEVCIESLNLGKDTRPDTLLGCKTVQIAS